MSPPHKGEKLVNGVLVCKYSRGGKRCRRVLFYNHAHRSLMWCKAVWGWTGKNGSRVRSVPPRLLHSCDLATLVAVCAGDEPDNKTPGKWGNWQLRRATKNDEALMSRSMSLTFKDRSLDIMLASKKEMHEFVHGFRSIMDCMSCAPTV